MLKSPKELKELDPESEDIYKKGVLERYSERPAYLEDLCLADFVAHYTFKGRSGTTKENEDDHQLEEKENDEDATKNFKVQGGTMNHRRHPKVIRFCRFSYHKDPVNFFRERLMLFYPWRNEEDELEKVNCEEIFIQNKNIIERNSQKFIAIDLDFNEIIKEIEERAAMNDNEEILNQESEDSETAGTSELNVYDYDDNVMQSNVMFEMGQEQAAINEVKRFAVPDQLSYEDFLILCDSLNVKQRDYLMHVLNCFKLKELPVYHFISGGAGVGKSRLIKAVYQSLTRFFRSVPGPVDEESPEILIVAFTGKAAHNVGGTTAHTAFSLPMVDGTEMKGLGPEALNTLRVKLRKLKLIIIDEISIMGVKILFNIHKRLCQVFRSTLPFGGKSLITLGDFNQLKPVRDNYVFKPLSNDLQSIIGNIIWEKFQLFELTEIMRQRNDMKFAEALGRLAIGEMTDEDIAMFKSRCFSESTLPLEGKEAIRLFWKNESIAEYNSKRLNDLNQQESFRIEYTAIDKVVGANSKVEINQALFNLKGKSADKTQGLPEKLIMQTGVHYMVTCNIDVSDGLFNGATGILRFVEITGGKANAVYLEFPDPSIGKRARENRYTIMQHNEAIKTSWTPILRTKLSFRTTKKSNVYVSMKNVWYKLN